MVFMKTVPLVKQIYNRLDRLNFACPCKLKTIQLFETIIWPMKDKVFDFPVPDAHFEANLSHYLQAPYKPVASTL